MPFPSLAEGPSLVVSRGIPLPRRLRRPRSLPCGLTWARGPPSHSRHPSRGSPLGKENLRACKTARYSRAAVDARVNGRTFIFLFPLSSLPSVFLVFSFPFSFYYFLKCLFVFYFLFSWVFFVRNFFAVWFICSRDRVISNRGYRLSSDSCTHTHETIPVPLSVRRSRGTNTGKRGQLRPAVKGRGDERFCQLRARLATSAISCAEGPDSLLPPDHPLQGLPGGSTRCSGREGQVSPMLCPTDCVPWGEGAVSSPERSPPHPYPSL